MRHNHYRLEEEGFIVFTAGKEYILLQKQFNIKELYQFNLISKNITTPKSKITFEQIQTKLNKVGKQIFL